MRKNEVFAKNINSIKNKYPNLYRKLSKSSNSYLDIQVLESRDKNKYMRINNGKKTININSRYSPIDEATKWAEGIELKNNSKLIIYGFGLSYRLKELSKKIKEDSSILIIEPNIDIFRNTVLNVDCSEIFEKDNISLLIGESIEEIKKHVLKYTNWTNMKNIDFIYMPNYEKLFKNELMYYVRIVKDIININLGNYNTIKRFSNLFYSNFIENIPHIVESINVKELFYKFKNKPVVIVSAGPSLAKNVELLNDIKNKSLIICVGTALRVLLDKGVKPDLVITVDPDIANYKHFEKIKFDDIPLIYYSCVNPNILNEHNGEKFVFKFQDIYLGEVIKNYMKDIGKLSSGGSVAHNALDLAIRMGANPIMFVGQDLAYTDNKTHSQGTIYENDRLERIEDNNKLIISKKLKNSDHKIREEKKTILIKDIYGNDVITDEVLYSYLKWLENVIESNNDRTYIDATEGGARIEGTNILTLNEAIERYCTNDIKAQETIHTIIKENKKNKVNIDKLLNDFNCIMNEIKEIVSKSSDIDKQIDGLIEKYDSISDANILKSLMKLEKVEKSIKSYERGFKAINFILNPVLLDINESISNKDNITLKEQLEINKSYFQGINKCANEALFLIEEFVENNFVKIMEFTININS